jgi:hypothetical protein
MAAQPSLLRQWQARFKATVASYLKAKAELDRISAQLEELSPDTALIQEHQAAHDRERMLRGVVRGGAQMLIILARPWDAKNTDAIKDMEIDYGMPGKRSKPRAQVSPAISKYIEDNR